MLILFWWGITATANKFPEDKYEEYLSFINQALGISDRDTRSDPFMGRDKLQSSFK